MEKSTEIINDLSKMIASLQQQIKNSPADEYDEYAQGNLKYLEGEIFGMKRAISLIQKYNKP